MHGYSRCTHTPMTKIPRLIRRHVAYNNYKIRDFKESRRIILQAVTELMEGILGKIINVKM